MIYVRKADAGEIHTLALLCVEFSNEVAPGRVTKLSIQDFEVAINTLTKRNGNVYVAVSRSSSRILGFMAIAEREALISGGGYLELSDLYVVPDERNRGIGRLMIEYAKSICRIRNIDRLTLSTGVPDHSSAPNTLYVRQGFEFIGPTFRALVGDV
ncbi:GNAT family N-acetyltransferase [Tritonibacter mobilis]|uniref:GNAT family N-acetyltransferase n=1 Tax=Tritonibacter mobilis TaxID=379347 RepID=UPI0009B9D3F3|nr:GNAT family N-acetyltransferase [Tritonibacter mobilis]